LALFLPFHSCRAGHLRSTPPIFVSSLLLTPFSDGQRRSGKEVDSRNPFPRPYLVNATMAEVFSSRDPQAALVYSRLLDYWISCL
jgi:hypothetical protein